MSFLSRGSTSNRHQLSSKEKKYVSNIDRALTQFESVDEWADYISYLSKLQKSLQSNPDPQVNHWVPNDFAISKTLAQCTSSKLPSGVHRKAIEVYETIFKILGSKQLSSSIQNWLPGILPLMSYASISVKPELIALFEDHIVKLDPLVLRVIFKSLLLSLLPALDDTTSDSFNAIMELIVNFKNSLNDNSHFWQCMFLCIMTSPDKRTGALEWCIKKLPTFSISVPPGDLKENEKKQLLAELSPEAASCVTPEPGLLIRAFCEGLKDDNVFVQRGFFDLLVSKLDLSSIIIQVFATTEDKKALILAASGAVLRKDMSLNRRLWNWLLGPEIQADATPSSPSATVTNKPDFDSISKNAVNSRSAYFEKFGLDILVEALFSLIDGKLTYTSVHQQRIHACKISVAIMDKWEIGQLIVPKILISIVHSTKNAAYDSTPDEFQEVLKNANTFFDGVESKEIWSEILKLIQLDDIETVGFIFDNFHIEDEDMIVTHIPLIFLSILLLKFSSSSTTAAKDQMCHNWIPIAKHLLDLIPQRALLPIEHASPQYASVDAISANYKDFAKGTLDKIESFYFSNSDEEIPRPISTADLTAIILSVLTKICTTGLETKTSSFYSTCDLLNNMLEKTPSSGSPWRDEALIKAINSLLGKQEKEEEAPVSVSIAFGLSSLFHSIAKSLTKFELLKFLKVVINQLWACLAHPTDKYQVEAVRQIWGLEISCEPSYIEAALASLFLNSNCVTRVRAFGALWAHSTSVNVSDIILTRPLLLILDDLVSSNETDRTIVSKKIKSFVTSSSINRVFKICCNALLQNCSILDNDSFDVNGNVDFDLFAYHLNTLCNLLSIDKKAMTSIFSTEMCAMDNDAHIAIIDKHKWDIATYKTLLINVILRFLSIESNFGSTEEDSVLAKQYVNCTKVALNLLEIIVDGTESNFVEIPRLLSNLCVVSTSSSTDLSFLNYYYLHSLSRFMKLSSDKGLDIELFQVPHNNKNISNFTEFFQAGMSNTFESIVFGAWMKLILDLAVYYPELAILSFYSITTCVCSKAEALFGQNQRSASITEDMTLVDYAHDTDESIVELASGLKDFLEISYHYYSSSLFDSRSHNSGSIGRNIADKTNETGFFGNVIQGVFQVETPTQRNEELERRNSVLQTLKEVVKTSYKIWLWADENSKIESNSNTFISIIGTSPSALGPRFNDSKRQPELIRLGSKDSKDDTLMFSKSLKHNAEKLKFRAKKLLECVYSLERMETLETLISCRSIQRNSTLSSNSFKIIHVLDGSKSQSTLPLIFNSLISRVSSSSLPASSRSSLITNLSASEITGFLVEYAESLSNDAVEDVWQQVLLFIKEVTSNSSLYKFVFADILKFSTIICLKLSQSSYGEQRKSRKELTDTFVKVLNACVSAKFSDESSVASLLNPMNILPGSDSYFGTDTSNSSNTNITTTNATVGKSNVDVSVTGKGREQSPAVSSSSTGDHSKQTITREDLCQSLLFVIPKIQSIVQDNDKVVLCYTTCVSNALIPLLKSQPLNAMPYHVRSLFVKMSEIPIVTTLKVWKTLCNEILSDSKFFSFGFSMDDIELLNKILQRSFSEDKDKMSELIAKILPSSGGSNIFNWSDSEGPSRILNMKRVIYLLMISPADSYLVELNNLQSKISDILNSSSSTIITSYALLILRVIVLKFSESHLSPFWPMIYTKLQTVFQDLLEQVFNFTQSLPVSSSATAGSKNNSSSNIDQIPQLDKVKYDCDLLLNASKLLDVLLMLKKEEFQLVEWLFVNETADAIYPNKNVPVLALIDQLSNLKEMRVFSSKSSDISDRIGDAIKKEKRVPLLCNIGKCTSITDLKSFFDNLSIHNYESDYSFKAIDVKSAEEDVFHDLFINN